MGVAAFCSCRQLSTLSTFVLATCSVDVKCERSERPRKQTCSAVVAVGLFADYFRGNIGRAAHVCLCQLCVCVCRVSGLSVSGVSVCSGALPIPLLALACLGLGLGLGLCLCLGLGLGLGLG